MNKIDIINENINEIDVVQTHLFEKRVTHIREKAISLFQDVECFANLDENYYFFITDIFREKYTELNDNYIFDFTLHSIKQNYDELNSFYSEMKNLEKIYFCKIITSLYSKKYADKKGLNINHFFNNTVEDREKNVISYFKNSYADKAYDKFAKVIIDPLVSYCSDFNSVCEDVYYNRADFCILPIENSNDGKLVSFYNLIKKYELKITFSCDVTTGNELYNTKFALLKKNIEYIECQPKNGSDIFFEFSIILSNQLALSDILIAAQNYKILLYKIDSMPISYTDREYSYDLIFKVDNADLQSFLCYLYLEAPQFIPTGIYTHLNI